MFASLSNICRTELDRIYSHHRRDSSLCSTRHAPGALFSCKSSFGVEAPQLGQVNLFSAGM